MTPDDHSPLPDDLQDVDRLLREQRPHADGVQLDALWTRVQRRADATPRRSGSSLRGRLVAIGLTLGLIGASSVGAVMASTSVSGTDSSIQTFTGNPKDAGSCQYKDTYSKDVSTMSGGGGGGGYHPKVWVSYDCKTRTICIEVGGPDKDMHGYQFSGKSKVKTNPTIKYCVKVPSGSHWFKTKAGTTDYTFDIPRD
jgi:hypothetical protein